MRTFLILFMGLSTGFGGPLTSEMIPLGTKDRPLVMRTFLPDPEMDAGVFVNHGKAEEVAKQRSTEGEKAEGESKMLKAVPAGIAVNHGPSLSYVWDTTECRMLYAWQGGFLDFYPTWSDEGKNEGLSFDGTPRLVGSLFYVAKPAERAKPKFLGYTLSKEGVPTFQFKLGAKEYTQTVEPVNRSFTFKVTTSRGERSDSTTYTGELVSRHHGFSRDLKFKKATTEAGKEVFQAYGCVACHSDDGSKGHGPSLKGLYGSTRPILEGDPVLADEAYLKESISKPNAKTAEGYPPGYMAPYKLNDMEVASLMLFLKSLAE